MMMMMMNKFTDDDLVIVSFIYLFIVWQGYININYIPSFVKHSIYIVKSKLSFYNQKKRKKKRNLNFFISKLIENETMFIFSIVKIDEN